jgi:hypothetical protein
MGGGGEGVSLLEFLFFRIFFCFFGCCLSFCFLVVLGIFFLINFIMASSLRLPFVRNISCVHCFDLNILYGFSKHVKSAHLLASLISQAS